MGGTGRRRKGSLLKELPVLLAVVLVLALLVKTFLVQAFVIPSGSMEKTRHGCTGDRVLVTKPPYWFSDPHPGDVVVFTGPGTWAPAVPTQEPSNWFTGALTWVGRAVGGQTVRCCDPQGRVTVDGEPLDEPYIYEPKPIETRAFGPVSVPEGRLFVMGDHRAGSSDSTAHIDDEYSGTIAVDDVIGNASLIVWPLGRFGFVDSPHVQRSP